MAFPVGTRITGEFITPAIWNADFVANMNFIQPRGVRKTADQSISSNTSLQNATDMSFPIGASEVWTVEIRSVFNIPGAPDAKVHWTTPSGATGHHWYLAPSASNRVVIANDIVIAGTGADEAFNFYATVINSTTPGTVQFQFAQNTSDASAVTMYANAVILPTRIA